MREKLELILNIKNIKNIKNLGYNRNKTKRVF